MLMFIILQRQLRSNDLTKAITTHYVDIYYNVCFYIFIKKLFTSYLNHINQIGIE